MFKQQLSPRTVHPYQTTVVPRSEQQFASAAQQRAKFPWAEDINTPVYQVAGTDSSTSDNAYHMPHYYNGTMRDYGPPSPVYQSPYGGGTWHNYKKVEKIHTHRPPTEAYSFPQCASAFSLPLCDVDPHTQTVSRSPVPPVPSISPEVPIIGACGGHCPGFEYVCYYILQVIFVVGILTGISLCIAGIVLRRTNRNGDLGVLVYIGCLSSCVCGVLLGVQCCVRREIRQRKLRANMHIPMQSIQEQPAQACPLLTSTLPHSQIYREHSEMRVCINDLSSRINQLEQQSRANNVEIQCLPEKKQENLIEIVSQLSKVVGSGIQDNDIKHCTRVAKQNASNSRPRAVVVQLASPRNRDQFLAATMKFNKSNPDNKLNTTHLGYSGPKSPIYIREHLSTTNKALHAAARIKAKEIGYQFVWVRGGRIFMRKAQDSEHILVTNEDTLNKLV